MSQSGRSLRKCHTVGSSDYRSNVTHISEQHSMQFPRCSMMSAQSIIHLMHFRHFSQLDTLVLSWHPQLQLLSQLSSQFSHPSLLFPQPMTCKFTLIWSSDLIWKYSQILKQSSKWSECDLSDKRSFRSTISMCRRGFWPTFAQTLFIAWSHDLQHPSLQVTVKSQICISIIYEQFQVWYVKALLLLVRYYLFSVGTV